MLFELHSVALKSMPHGFSWAVCVPVCGACMSRSLGDEYSDSPNIPFEQVDTTGPPEYVDDPVSGRRVRVFQGQYQTPYLLFQDGIRIQVRSRHETDTNTHDAVRWFVNPSYAPCGTNV